MFHCSSNAPKSFRLKSNRRLLVLKVASKMSAISKHWQSRQRSQKVSKSLIQSNALPFLALRSIVHHREGSAHWVLQTRLPKDFGKNLGRFSKFPEKLNFPTIRVEKFTTCSQFKNPFGQKFWLKANGKYVAFNWNWRPSKIRRTHLVREPVDLTRQMPTREIKCFSTGISGLMAKVYRWKDNKGPETASPIKRLSTLKLKQIRTKARRALTKCSNNLLPNIEARRVGSSFDKNLFLKALIRWVNLWDHLERLPE